MIQKCDHVQLTTCLISWESHSVTYSPVWMLDLFSSLHECAVSMNCTLLYVIFEQYAVQYISSSIMSVFSFSAHLKSDLTYSVWISSACQPGARFSSRLNTGFSRHWHGSDVLSYLYVSTSSPSGPISCYHIKMCVNMLILVNIIVFINKFFYIVNIIFILHFLF